MRPSPARPAIHGRPGPRCSPPGWRWPTPRAARPARCTDALDPFRRELRARAADGLPTAWRTAAEAATRAAADTARLIPTRGREARRGALGHGHPDAGAVSLALLLTAIGGTLR
ncbi:DAK2 domain-containing protein [Streptomyces noursei]|uniref:DAK2 domain-containing protein n=1 Tax=Streptomyces noursei TaxID=1971 RepID=UPI0038197F6C